MLVPSVIILIVFYAERFNYDHNAECYYPECNYSECRYAECRVIATVATVCVLLCSLLVYVVAYFATTVS
jgi:hypothetical protein